MEDDIRDLLYGKRSSAPAAATTIDPSAYATAPSRRSTGNTIAGRESKAAKSRSQSTTAAKLKKKKKKKTRASGTATAASTTAKSKSKSTTAGKQHRRSKSKNRDASDDIPLPDALTLEIPAAAAAGGGGGAAAASSSGKSKSDKGQHAGDKESSSSSPTNRMKSSVPKHLREILNAEILTAPTSTTPRRGSQTRTRKTTQKEEGAVEDQIKKSRAASDDDDKKKKKKKNSSEKEEEEEEKEEPRKRRERLMQSPFEYLQIQHRPIPILASDHADSSSADFHDDISFLTLPKPLRELEKMNHQEKSELSVANNSKDSSISTSATGPSKKEDKAVVKDIISQEGQASSNTISTKKKKREGSFSPADEAPAGVPGWSRKAKSEQKERRRTSGKSTERVASKGERTELQSSSVQQSPPSPKTAPTNLPLSPTTSAANVSSPTHPEKSSAPFPNANERRKVPSGDDAPKTRSSKHKRIEQRRDSEPIPPIQKQDFGESLSTPVGTTKKGSAKNRRSSDPTPQRPSESLRDENNTSGGASDNRESFAKELSTQISRFFPQFLSARRNADAAGTGGDVKSELGHEDIEQGTMTSSSGDTNRQRSQEAFTSRRSSRYLNYVGAAACLFFVVCITAILVIVLAREQDKDSKTATDTPTTPGNNQNNTSVDQFFYLNPIELTVPDIPTSEMGNFDSNCDHFDQSGGFGHVWDQCRCEESVRNLPADVVDMRNTLLDVIIPPIYGPLEDLAVPDVSSCHPGNLALLWLASGDNRKAGYLLQRFVLALFYFETSGPDWDYSNDWLSSSNECLWLGVQCNSNSAINGIALDTNNIHGTIPTEFGLLQGLEGVSMTRNHLRGTIPTELFSLPGLHDLCLYSNELNGPIPPEIGNASNLKSLRLSKNFLGGLVPTEIGSATSLTDLDLGFNEFGGELPLELGQLTKLQYLTLTENRLSGRIPRDMGLMTSLQNVTLSQNTFQGPLPSDFGRLKELQDLRINDAGVSGAIPTEFGLLSNLRVLQLTSNILMDGIPTEFGTLFQLEDLRLSGNQIEGRMPSTLGNLVSLKELRLEDNALTGMIPSQLGRLSSLSFLSLDQNDMTGTVPNAVCRSFQEGGIESFVVDCPNTNTGTGIDCDSLTCCSFCRRSDRRLQ